MDAQSGPSFVAVAALLGEPLDTIVEALGANRAVAAPLLRALRSTDRTTRAQAIAQVVTEIAVSLDSLRIA